MKPITSEDIQVWVDGKEVELPKGTRSVKLVNINSAINGIFLWGSGASYKSECQDWTPPRLDDGKLEVMSTGGVKNMIGYRLNYSHAHRIAQTRHVVWEIKREMEMQIDGEAWIQKPCRIEFQLRDQIPVAIGKFGCRGVHEDVLKIHENPSPEFGDKRKSWVQSLDTLTSRKHVESCSSDSQTLNVNVTNASSPI